MLNELVDDVMMDRQSLAEIILNRQIDLKLIVIYSINFDKGNRYVKRLILTFKGRPILCNYPELVLFMEEIVLFDRGDSFNTYFKIVLNKDKHNPDANPTYLLLDSPVITMIISRSMAKSISKIWEMYLRGFSMSYLLENSEHIEIKECAKMLVGFQYLSCEQYESMGFNLDELY